MSDVLAADLFAAPGMGLLLAIATSLALSLLLAGVGMLVLDRITLRTKLREIDDLYKLVGVRDQELMLPFVDRMSGPVQAILIRLGRRFSPSGYAEEVRVLMLRAGRLDPSAPDRFLAMRALTLLSAPVAAVLTLSALSSLGTAAMRAGASRANSLKNLGERVKLPEVQSFVLAIRQADEFGISVASVLRTQSDEMRVRRRQLAQEKAMKAPVKMLLPMVFFIFPPIFLIVIGPAGIQITSSGGL